MRILLLITKGEVGGAQQSVLALAKGLKLNGHDVTVGFGDGEFLRKELNGLNINFVIFKYLKRSLNPIINWRFVKEIKEHFKKNYYHILHCNSSNTLFAAFAIKGLPEKPKVVFTFRGLSILDKNYKNIIARTFYKIFFKKFLHNVDRQVFVSRVNQIAAKALKIENNSVVIYNGINPPSELLTKDSAQIRLAILSQTSFDNKIVVGSIGRLAYQKNYLFLIESLAKYSRCLDKIKLLIIGDGPEKNSLQKKIKEMNLKDVVILLGAISGASSLLPAFDIFVLPSLYEGMSLTLIEALTAKLPIIASRNGANEETLADAAVFFNLNDGRDLAAKLDNFVNNLSQLDHYKNESENRARIFDVAKTVTGYESTYKSLIAN